MITKILKDNLFVLLLGVVIFLAYLAPGVGGDYGVVSGSQIAGWGVSFVFFFYGLKLPISEFARALVNVKLHVVVQLATFVLFPLLVLAVVFATGVKVESSAMWLGIFFVACLPSTVSSSVVMVSIAGGNVGAAVFNASISSLIGVFITPLWMSMFMSKVAGGVSFSGVVLELILQVLCPIVLGMLLHKHWGKWANAHSLTLKWFDQSVILAIVYTSFCESFARDMFAGVAVSTLLWLSVGMIGLFFVVYLIIGIVCRWLKFSTQDRIVALYCGSKKSLVHGTVMGKVLVADAALLGVVLLPIMIYHALQLVVVSILAQRQAKA